MRAVMVILSLVVACGSPDEDKKEDAPKLSIVLPIEKPSPAPLEGKLKINFFSKKSLWVDDELFELSCNEYFMKFAMTLAVPDCRPVEATSNFTFETEAEGGDSYNAWKIQSPTKDIDFVGREESGEEKITIGEDKLFCYLYTGDAYDVTGENIFGGTFTILSKSALTKISSVNATTDIKAVLFSNQRACEALVPI